MNPQKRTTTEPGLGKVNPDSRRAPTMAEHVDDDGGPGSTPPVESRRLTRDGVPAAPASVPSEQVAKASSVKARVETKPELPRDLARSRPPVRRDSVGDQPPQSRRDPRQDDEPAAEAAPRSPRTPATPATRSPMSSRVSSGPSNRVPARLPSTSKQSAQAARTVPLTREAQAARAQRDAEDVRDGSSRGLRPAELRRTASLPKQRAIKPDSAPPPRTDTRRRTLAESRPGIAVDRVAIGSAVKAGGPDAVRLTPRSIPRLVLTKSEIAAAPIDHRAGFLLAYIDGSTTVQGLVDIEVMPEREVHEILDRLRRLGIVAIR